MVNEYEAILTIMNHILLESWPDTGTKVAHLARPMSPPLGVGLCVFQPKALVQRDFKANVIKKGGQTSAGKNNLNQDEEEWATCTVGMTWTMRHG